MSTSNSGLFEMLADMAKNPEVKASFIADRDAVMSQYGLTYAQQALIKSSMDNNAQHDFHKALGDAAQSALTDENGLFLTC